MSRRALLAHFVGRRASPEFLAPSCRGGAEASGRCPCVLRPVPPARPRERRSCSSSRTCTGSTRAPRRPSATSLAALRGHRMLLLADDAAGARAHGVAAGPRRRRSRSSGSMRDDARRMARALLGRAHVSTPLLGDPARQERGQSALRRGDPPRSSARPGGIVVEQGEARLSERRRQGARRLSTTSSPPGSTDCPSRSSSPCRPASVVGRRFGVSLRVARRGGRRRAGRGTPQGPPRHRLRVPERRTIPSSCTASSTR